MEWPGSDMEPLLKTKLFVPGSRSASVVRPRLLARLDEGLSRKLTLIAAPPGFGKSTLLSDWAATLTGRRTPLGWVSLEEAENQPGRFWFYVTTALEQLQPGAFAEPLSLLQAPQAVPVDAVVRSLVNAAAELRNPCVLVLDDYHAITNEAINQAVTFLLEHMPAQLHLCIATRTDPALPLTRLRARGQLIELRIRDLRFTAEEAGAFCEHVSAVRLTPGQVAQLAARTEGWIAGLQLAALSLQGAADADEFVAAFSGSHQYIVDYLVEEVLQQQSGDVQRFLLQTALLDRLSGPLCDAVTGSTGSQAMLEALEKRNLFVIALDQQRQWYRYHHLFGAVLRERLKQAEPGQEAVLHMRAAEWYEQQGLVERAVGHALAAGDIQRAERMVGETAAQVWKGGNPAIVLEWLESLPQDLLRARPDLCIPLAWCCVGSARLNQAESLLRVADDCLRAPREPAQGNLLGMVAAIRAHIARLQRDPDRSAALTAQALAMLLPENRGWRGMAVWNAAALHQWAGKLTAATDAYAEALSLFEAAGELLGAQRVIAWRAELLADTEQLPEAWLDLQRAFTVAESRGWANRPMVCVLHAGMGQVLYERNDLEGAERHLRQTLELARQGGMLDMMWTAYLALALSRQAQGDGEAALEHLDAAVSLAQSTGVPWMLAYIGPYRVRLLLARGEVAAAAALAPAIEALVQTGGAPAPVAARALAMLRLAQGRPADALTCLEPLSGAGYLSLAALEAVALHGAGRPGEAVPALGEALRLAGSDGNRRAFIDVGHPMADLLAAGLPTWQGAVKAAASSLLAQLSPMPQLMPQPQPQPTPMPMPQAMAPAGHALAPGLVEPLSQREREVLILLAEGASNDRIARQLYVTLHTVKKHVAHILGKLGVANRTQAAARGRELGLL